MSDPLASLSIDAERLKYEIKAMLDEYPESQLVKYPSTEYPLGWSMVISSEDNEYHIVIWYPTDYPERTNTCV